MAEEREYVVGDRVRVIYGVNEGCVGSVDLVVEASAYPLVVKLDKDGITRVYARNEVIREPKD